MKKVVVAVRESAPRVRTYCRLADDARIEQAIRDRTFGDNEAWQNGLASTRKRGGRAHVIGERGRVAEALLATCERAGVEAAFLAADAWRTVDDADSVFCLLRDAKLVRSIARRRTPTCYFATLTFMRLDVPFAFGPDFESLRGRVEIREGGTGSLVLWPDGMMGKGLHLAASGTTADVAPTVLKFLGVAAPSGMGGTPLF